MRNGLIGLVSAMALACAVATAACSDYSSGGSGGSGGTASSEDSGASTGGQQSTGGSATGGDSATGGTPSCTNGSPCGGDLVGTWTVTSSCLTVSGELDLSIIGLGVAGQPCDRAQITGGSLQVSGTFTVNSDTTFSDNTTTTGDVQFTLVDNCLNWSGTRTTCSGVAQSAFPSLGFTTGSSCQDKSGGGCTCHGPVSQSGEMGVVAMSPFTNGTATTSGTVVTLSDGFNSTSHSYCASGNTLTLTPQTTLPITTGTIVLQKQ